MNEVDERLLRFSKKKIIGCDPINRIGIRVPVLRAELKNYNFFSGLSRGDILYRWDQVWKKSPYFESMSLTLYAYQGKNLNNEETNTIITWVERCTCWEHSDDLSKIYAQILEEHPDWILNKYKKWNKSKELWKRRQSVVGLLEYSSKRKKILPFTDLIKFVTPLLNDSEYYVQKGIGWTLREIFNAYPDKTLKYFKQNLLEISPVAYSAGTKKIDKTIKLNFNRERKNNRKKKRSIKVNK